MTAPVPLVPTHVVGSHGFLGRFWTALDSIKAGAYGATDLEETYDGTRLARKQLGVA